MERVRITTAGVYPGGESGDGRDTGPFPPWSAGGCLACSATAWEKEVGCYQVTRTTRLLADGVLLPSVKRLSSSVVRVLIKQEEEIKL